MKILHGAQSHTPFNISHAKTSEKNFLKLKSYSVDA